MTVNRPTASSRRFPNERTRRTDGAKGTAAEDAAPGTRSRYPRITAERAHEAGRVRALVAWPRRAFGVYNRCRAGRVATLRAEPSGHGHCPAAGGLRPDRARRECGAAFRQPPRD